jgi:hypothetical protein
MEGGGPQKIVTVANLGNYKAIEDWWFILPAIWFVDTVVIFLARFFPQYLGKPLNEWYDEFGLAASISDVLIIAIVIAITRYIYTIFFMEEEGWSIWYFIGLAILIQIIHDLIFAFGVIKPIPQGHNSMIDVFKKYMQHGPVIVAADAAMVAGSIGLAAYLKNRDYHYTISVALLTGYSLTYILYTNIKV